MGLDAVILPICDENLARQVQIGLSEHTQLVKLAQTSDGCPVIKSIADYYVERDLSLSEVTALLNELEQLQKRPEPSEVCRSMILDLIRLCKEAAKGGNGIALLPD